MMEAVEFKEHLLNNLIPFWNRLRDNTYGGFYGMVTHDSRIVKEAVKGVILNSRILWFYSKAYITLKDESLLDMAAHAYAFLRDCCLDKQYGGVYWSLNYDANPIDSEKHTYNQAFAIYALSTYYQAGGEKEALDLAYTLYHLIEEKCRDEDGYLEAFNRNFTPASNEKLSENGVMAERTMNTLLHVLEAYTELYRAGKSSEVKDSLCRVLDVFQNKIYNPEKQIFEVFFDKNYNSLIDLESYGHNIEASWLIDRACEALKSEGSSNCVCDIDEKFLLNIEKMTKGLAEAVYRNAYDSKLHALNNEREGSQIDKRRIWWVQAESVIGFYNAYQKAPEKVEYKEAAENIWKFIITHVIDKKSGEWYENLGENALPEPNQALVHPWKCPYHNGRMCMEMMERLEGSCLLK